MSSQTQVEETLDLSKFFDNLWVAIVWDDPVNLMNYVTYVFIKLFGFSKEKAHKLMRMCSSSLLNATDKSLAAAEPLNSPMIIPL